jgi:hypothetical protein
MDAEASTLAPEDLSWRLQIAAILERILDNSEWSMHRACIDGLAEREIRSYVPEPERGQRHWSQHQSSWSRRRAPLCEGRCTHGEGSRGCGFA